MVDCSAICSAKIPATKYTNDKITIQWNMFFWRVYISFYRFRYGSWSELFDLVGPKSWSYDFPYVFEVHFKSNYYGTLRLKDWSNGWPMNCIICLKNKSTMNVFKIYLSNGSYFLAIPTHIISHPIDLWISLPVTFPIYFRLHFNQIDYLDRF